MAVLRLFLKFGPFCSNKVGSCKQKCALFSSSFSKNPYTVDKWLSDFETSYTGLATTLPRNVHILTLQRTNTHNQLLLRLEHYFEKDEDETLSRPVSVNIRNMFRDFHVTSFTEMNLSANQLLKDKHAWRWNTGRKEEHGYHFVDPVKVIQRRSLVDETFDILLNPMQIRTFILEVEYTN